VDGIGRRPDAMLMLPTLLVLSSIPQFCCIKSGSASCVKSQRAQITALNHSSLFAMPCPATLSRPSLRRMPHGIFYVSCCHNATQSKFNLERWACRSRCHSWRTLYHAHGLDSHARNAMTGSYVVLPLSCAPPDATGEHRDHES